MSHVFESTTYQEALKLASEGEDWIVENIIGSATTLIYGEAKVGKSFLISALVKALATGKPFLGKPVQQDRAFSIALLWTDDRGDAEYSGRIDTVMPEGECPRVQFYQVPIMRTPEMWQSLYEQVLNDGHNFVVVDNLAQTLNGTINDDNAVREFFDGVRKFVRAGIPVVVVAHSSDKAGPTGRKPDTPMGSAYITQAVRWRVFVRRSNRGNITLKFMGNSAEPYEMTLHHGAGARFEVLDTMTPEALRAQREGNEKAKRERDKVTLDRNAEQADWIVSNCQGKSVRETAAALAEKFDGSENSYRAWLKPGGKLGGLVNREGDSWSRNAA
ncbi:AAA family ATPase [Nocardia sp. NPDC020380]|uniref:AAA family ATPase n=1 Tax=Nocardia sp. NPDC020380 TaxID=3364309 RepID=UPI00378A57E1